MKEVIGRNISIISKERQLSSINMWCKYVASNMASNVASNVAKDRLYRLIVLLPTAKNNVSCRRPS